MTEYSKSDDLNASLNKLRMAMVAGTRQNNQSDNIAIGGRYLCHLEAYPRQLGFLKPSKPVRVTAEFRHYTKRVSLSSVFGLRPRDPSVIS